MAPTSGEWLVLSQWFRHSNALGVDQDVGDVLDVALVRTVLGHSIVVGKSVERQS
jgi:hypothetical protein